MEMFLETWQIFCSSQRHTRNAVLYILWPLSYKFLESRSEGPAELQGYRPFAVQSNGESQ